MTTYGAYDAGLPCKNTACKSHGKPHPNCRCYGDMADGGEASHYCSEDRAHQSDCEYFADGGEVPEGYEPVEDEPTADVAGSGEVPEDYEAIDDSAPEGYEPVEETHTPGEHNKFLAGVEGATRGFFGPISEVIMRAAPVIVGNELITPEARAAREKAEPGVFHSAEAATMLGGLATGTGEAGLIAKATEAKVGSKILQQAIQGGLFQASDEASKWAMGQGDPQDAAGAALSIGASALFSGFLGAVGQGASAGAKKSLEGIAESKLGERALGFLHGIAEAAKHGESEAGSEAISSMIQDYGMSAQSFKNGMKFFNKAIAPTTGMIGAWEGYKENGVAGAFERGLEGLAGGFLAKKLLSPVAKKTVAPALMWMLSKGSVAKAAEAFDHVAQLAHGDKLINSAVDNLFKNSSVIGKTAVSAYGTDKLRKDIDTFLGNGGMSQSLQDDYYDQNAAPTPEGYAKGGEVKKADTPKPQKSALSTNNGVAIHYPEHNVLLSAARARVSGYLAGLRPQEANHPAFPFDEAPDNGIQKRAYERAMNIAISPLSVMHEVEKGTLEPEHVKHLSAMYPELESLLQKRVTHQVLKAQMDGTKPGYAVRQSLSLLLGTPLSASLTPQGIQAAQAVFAPKQGQAQPAGQPPSGNKSKLSKSDQAFLTGPQSLVKRSQRDK